MLRLLRVLRVLKLFQRLSSLRVIINSLLKSILPVANAFLVLFLVCLLSRRCSAFFFLLSLCPSPTRSSSCSSCASRLLLSGVCISVMSVVCISVISVPRPLPRVPCGFFLAGVCISVISVFRLLVPAAVLFRKSIKNNKSIKEQQKYLTCREKCRTKYLILRKKF